MPPDTIPTGANLKRYLDSLGEVYQKDKLAERPNYPYPEWLMFIFVFVVLVGSIYFYILRPAWREKRKRMNRYRKPEQAEAAREIQYDGWLKRYNKYYACLSSENKKRFLYRMIRFMESKEFRFHSMVEEEYIPVLVSGAAVQMTFGLPNYLMDYYPVIHVIRKEYTLHFNKETYYGHVSRTGIYISWTRFLEGYDNYEDADNVGLHEMAHALTYDIILGDENIYDRAFKERLSLFYKQGTMVFRAIKGGRHGILEPYATSNFDEFWAVCVEHFFENSEELRAQYPDLYHSMVHLLNQDPLSPALIINPQLAGLGF